MFVSVNPCTEEVIAKTPFLSEKERLACIHRADRAYPSWRAMGLNQKIELIQNLKILLAEEKPTLARLMSQEMGKPLSQALAEVEKSQSFCDYVSKVAPKILADQKKLPFAPKGCYVTFQAMGVILGIMPWNFPLWQTLRCALPALLGGNVLLVKPAENVFLSALKLQKLFIKAGFAKGVLQVLPLSIKQTEKVIIDSRIRGVSLTGSVKAGRRVASLAGQHLKKVVLELGGSDPYLVLDSADLKHAAKECVHARMNNSGQSCIAAKRFIVTQKVAKNFISFVKAEMMFYKQGDPLNLNTRLGPLARKDLRDHLQSQVQTLLNRGAKLIMGGRLTKGERGFFYPPTLLSVSARAYKKAQWREELFGPVALVVVVAKEDRMLEVANQSPYGLGGAVFSGDGKQAEHLARECLQAGGVAVNQALHSHSALPFGGVKDSGYGRELSAFGFYEFLNIKTIFKKEG